MPDSFPSQEVIALTGVTARQLQWWDERGVVKPERVGHRRLYSMQNVMEMAVICELRRKSFSLQGGADRKSTRLDSRHTLISYALFCFQKKTKPCTKLSHPTVECRRL